MASRPTQTRRLHQGFTLIEVGVVVPIILLCAVSMVNILWATLNTSTTDRERLNMAHDKQIAMTTVEGDVALTSRFLTTLEAGLTDPYPPTSNGGVWSYKGDSSTKRYLLLRAYSTTQNPSASNRKPVFIGSGTDCDPANLYFNNVQHYDVVYFVKNGNLYRRRVVDPTTATCSSQYQKTSCPSAIDLGTAQNASCGADDELLLTNVANFSINYYDSKTSTTPSDVYASGADPVLVTGAVDAEITLGVSKIAGGKTVYSQSTLRITKLNLDL